MVPQKLVLLPSVDIMHKLTQTDQGLILGVIFLYLKDALSPYMIRKCFFISSLNLLML